MPPSSRRERRLRARAPIRKFDGIRRRQNASAGTRQPHTYYQYASGCRAPADAPRHPPVMPPNFRITPLGRRAPHPPQRRRALAEPELLGDREAVALVEVAVARRGRLEVGGQAVRVAAVEDRPEQRGAEPAALPLGRDADEREVVVLVVRVVGLERGDRADAARRVAAV